MRATQGGDRCSYGEIELAEQVLAITDENLARV